MAGFTDCLKEVFSGIMPDDLGWWLLAVLIACIATGIVGGAITAGSAIPAILTGCLLVLGISLAGPTIIAAAGAILVCAKRWLFG